MSRALLALLIVGGALACRDGAAPRREDPLVIWIGGDKAHRGLQELGRRFTAALGVPVVVEYPEDAPGRFQRTAAVGKGPDVMIWAHDRIGEWARSGLIAPTPPTPELRARIGASGWDAVTLDGEVWGYPIAYETVALVYNRALVPEPPGSFEEILALDRTLRAGGVRALQWHYTNTYFTWGLLAAGGASPFAKRGAGYDARVTEVASDSVVAGAEFLVRMIEEGAMPRGADYKDMETGVNTSRVAMMINGPWCWANLRSSGIDFGVAPLPTFRGAPGRPFVGVLTAMLNAASPRQDLALVFLEEYVLTDAGLTVLDADVPLGVPAVTSFYEALAAQDPAIRASQASAANGTPMPPIPEMARFWAAMEPALENMTQGRQAPRAALEDAARRILAAASDER